MCQIDSLDEPRDHKRADRAEQAPTRHHQQHQARVEHERDQVAAQNRCRFVDCSQRHGEVEALAQQCEHVKLKYAVLPADSPARTTSSR